MDNNKDELTVESPPVLLNSSFSRVFDKQNICMEIGEFTFMFCHSVENSLV